MKTIIQIFTGGWKTANYTAEAIVKRLEEVTSLLPVEKVIIGWNLDQALYRQVGSFLKKRSIDMLLWLPVFAESNSLYDAHEALDINGKTIKPPKAMGEESFSFCCPTSLLNRENGYRIYEEHFRDCGFAGVFLDRIRTQSFVSGVPGVLSCGCERCRKAFMERGVDLDRVRALYEEKKDHFFDAAGCSPEKGFAFRETLAERFFEVKGELVSEAVVDICGHFQSMGMQTGLDLFAPLMSVFVGQPFEKISEKADFIKPMLYRKTEAPAGIGFEYELLKKCAPEAIGYPDLVADEDFLRRQALAFAGLPCGKYPGIEVNYREDIARTDPKYIRESLRVLRDAGMDGVTLSWDVMLAPDDHLKAVSECASGI